MADCRMQIEMDSILVVLEPVRRQRGQRTPHVEDDDVAVAIRKEKQVGDVRVRLLENHRIRMVRCAYRSRRGAENRKANHCDNGGSSSAGFCLHVVSPTVARDRRRLRSWRGPCEVRYARLTG